MLRFLKTLTLRRIIYIALGVSMVVHSLLYKQYLGIGIGAYFAAMGLFSIGCAAPNCGLPANQVSNTTDEVIFNEIE